MDSSSNPRAAVVIMAKRAIPGRVKTRLCGELSATDAASLYEHMLADRCEQVMQLRDVVPAVAYAPDGGDGDSVAYAPDGFEAVPQPDGDLGAGLAAAAQHFAHRAIPVVLVDSDSVTLPLAYLEEAVDRLCAGADLVIGPAEDGGYYLIGLARPTPELFRDIPWSTNAVVSKTVARAAALNMSAHMLPRWWDIDTPEDLERLRQVLFESSWPPRTASWLRARATQTMGGAPPRTDSAPAELAFEPWRRLSSRAVYATPWLKIRDDLVQLPDGGLTNYSVVDCGQCVGILPFIDPDTVLLVRQYRYVANRVTWEMPTGGVHAGESIEAAALRELAEEGNVRPGRLDRLTSYHTSKSVMDETAHLFSAHDLEPAAARGDDTEFIHAEPVPFRHALEMVLSGEITDSMTIIAILLAARTI